VNWNGPSLIDLLNDFTPRSVMLKPLIVLSKLNADRLVIVCLLVYLLFQSMYEPVATFDQSWKKAFVLRIFLKSFSLLLLILS
jgi:hypothetical protein